MPPTTGAIAALTRLSDASRPSGKAQDNGDRPRQLWRAVLELSRLLVGRVEAKGAYKGSPTAWPDWALRVTASVNSM